MSALAGGVLSALGSVGSSLLSNSSARKNQREMLQYNSMPEQVRRMRKAGINPALALQNGAIDSGNASAPADTMPSFDINSLAAGVRDSIQLRQQGKLNDAMIDEHRQNALATQIRNRTQLQRDLADLENIRNQSKEHGKNTEWLDKQIEFKQKEINAFDDLNAANLGHLRAQARLLSEEATTESALRGLKKLQLQAGIRLSKSQSAYFVEQAKSVAEGVEQMKMNGASQREINSFIRDKERETARHLHFENENWYTKFNADIKETEARTKKLGREHQTQQNSFFGIPLGTREEIRDYSNGVPNLPMW